MRSHCKAIFRGRCSNQAPAPATRACQASLDPSIAAIYKKQHPLTFFITSACFATNLWLAFTHRRSSSACQRGHNEGRAVKTTMQSAPAVQLSVLRVACRPSQAEQVTLPPGLVKACIAHTSLQTPRLQTPQQAPAGMAPVPRVH